MRQCRPVATWRGALVWVIVWESNTKSENISSLVALDSTHVHKRKTKYTHSLAPYMCPAWPIEFLSDWVVETLMEVYFESRGALESRSTRTFGPQMAPGGLCMPWLKLLQNVHGVALVQ